MIEKSIIRIRGCSHEKILPQAFRNMSEPPAGEKVSAHALLQGRAHGAAGSGGARYSPAGF